MRDALRRLFVATLADLDVPRALTPALTRFRPLAERGDALLVIAFGKAARPMATACRDALAGARLRGLVVPPEPDAAPLPPFEVIAGGHPLPTDGSLRAARRALELATGVGPAEQVLFLVSGGGSAALELPADPAVTLAELRQLYRTLVGCGGDIAAINTVRRWCSAVKGGRLALAAANAASQCTLAISDVRDGDWRALASGPTVADDTAIADCRAVLDRFALWPALPAALRTRIERTEVPPPLRPGDELARRTEFLLVQGNADARTALRRHAEAAGMLVAEDQSVDDLPYGLAAERLLARLDELRAEHRGRAVAVLTGGEVTVQLPSNAGVGGRNQQFALECARRIAGCPISVLSAGTDGVDGTAPAAGAVADGTTLARARALGLDVEDHLRRFDAHPLFDALGDSVTTGPTGQNVRDLRLLVHEASPRP